MTTLEAQHEVITNLILENKKLMQERDEARNKMADALQEVDLRTLDFERMNQECYELRKELEEYRSIAENIGALKAVSEKEKAIRERDEAREALDRASLYISNHTGSCPYDLFGIEPHDSPCREVCDKYTNDMKLCWKKHFTNKETAK